MKKSGRPEIGEMVVCRITKIHPNSAFADLIEYDQRGMIHVSEVASRWVRNIREFLKVGQYVVCRVMKTDRETILLSVKRVRKEDANRKLGEFKRERKAEKMLELVGKDMKKSLQEAYQEVGFKLQDEFGSLSKAFENAIKNPQLFKSKVPKKWIEPLIDIAKKKYVEKVYRVRAEMNIVCYKPNGVGVIKRVLGGIKGDGIEVRYVSAPKYELIGTGKNFKETRALVEKTAEGIVKEIEEDGGEAGFEIVEK